MESALLYSATAACNWSGLLGRHWKPWRFPSASRHVRRKWRLRFRPPPALHATRLQHDPLALRPPQNLELKDLILLAPSCLSFLLIANYVYSSTTTVSYLTPLAHKLLNLFER